MQRTQINGLNNNNKKPQLTFDSKTLSRLKNV